MFFLLSNLLIFQFLSILSHIGIVYFSCNASCLHICIKHQLPRLNTDYSAICVLNTTTCKGVWQKKNQNTNVKYLIKFKYKIRLKKKTCSANLIKNTITIFILRYYVLRLRWGGVEQFRIYSLSECLHCNMKKIFPFNIPKLKFALPLGSIIGKRLIVWTI